MLQKDYWDGVTKEKQFTTPFQTDEFCKYVDKNCKILDVGCGYGRTLNELYQNGYHNLIGIDFSNGMINRGRQQFPYLNLQVKNTPEIHMPDSSIDAVILFAVLTCIRDDTEQKYLISEIRRVLKPGSH